MCVVRLGATNAWWRSRIRIGVHLGDKGSSGTDKGPAERGFVLARRAERCHRHLE